MKSHCSIVLKKTISDLKMRLWKPGPKSQSGNSKADDSIGFGVLTCQLKQAKSIKR
jgi:hypothetical protein